MSVFKLCDPENKNRCSKKDLIIGFNKIVAVIQDDILDFIMVKNEYDKVSFQNLFNNLD